MNRAKTLLNPLLLAALCGAPAFSQEAPPKPPAKKSSLPAAVRAETPDGILSVSLFRLAPAPGEKKFLFHLWTAARRDPDGGGSFGPPPGYYSGAVTAAEARAGGLRLSPFVLDIFAPGEKTGQWKYAASVATSATKAPAQHTLRFLDAKTKTGFVLSTYEQSFRTHAHTLHVFADGWDSEPTSDTFHGHVYMDSATYSFPRDRSGLLQVMKRDRKLNAAYETHTTMTWDSDGYGWKAAGPPVRVPVKK
jgi:hypothetical protein